MANQSSFFGGGESIEDFVARTLLAQKKAGGAHAGAWPNNPTFPAEWSERDSTGV